MPPVLFNAAAFIQALILGTILGILYLINIEALLPGVPDWIAVNVFLYTSFFIVCKMDLNGIKGRVFFLPTWLILIILTLYSAKDRNAPEWAFWLTLVLAVLLLVRFASKMDNRFKADFQNARIAAGSLQYIDTTTDEGKKKFWATATNAFIKPTNFYLFLYPLFKVLYPYSVTRDEFVAHYSELVPVLKKEVDKEKFIRWLENFEQSLTFKENYSHEPFSVGRVETIIDEGNRIVNKRWI